ncbi:hypothetical protein QBC33DRAFT_6288 [Phialemonium atrogriseum]|uniref:Uncharacterized protein n=1 Tax=Phialemonium atrogriseum TaxID=1093897 RepID=A0AAJ0FLL8_9PEZI|nr:uncharacterized protein QBC33DRAFT_6288 [Phialemonium atrogriseum]KAK1772347.1 hypothetical protein QBC33DRAFT_6288 [Phialemonium atrogriseum]
MAWDAKAGQSQENRSSSTAGGSKTLGLHVRQQSRQARQVRHVESAHLADPFLQGFVDPAFDPTEHLNATLAPLQTPGRPGQGAVPLSELSAQAQTLLSQLNAHTTRLTGTLTQLTDDIMRSGSRLAYEVELLRGETLGLAEALTDSLEADVSRFVPGGIQNGLDTKPSSSTAGGPESHRQVSAAPMSEAASDGPSQAMAPNEPPHITQLRTLTLVRSRLDSVIKTFGDSMEFVFPPSELSVSSSFLSVSAPDTGPEMHSTEEKGQQVLRKLRDEISQLLDNREDPIKGIEDAARRIEELKDLAKVWKGTAEEKGRTRFIESLAKMVEDRHRDLMKEAEHSSRRDGDKADVWNTSKKGSGGDADMSAAETKGYGGYGLMSQLQKLRTGL